jgi:hypothetical protein
VTAASQLDFFRAPPPKPKKPSKLLAICVCTHERDRDHAGGKGPCSFGAHVGAPCGCTKFKARGRKPIPIAPKLAAPAGALELVRPDTVRRKPMGWAHGERGKLVVYLEQLKTERPNVLTRWHRAKFSPLMQSRMHAAFANKCKAQAERASSALEQAHAHFGAVITDKRPARVTITRVSGGSIGDDDGLIGALKWIRDGIAEALCFDDKNFSVAGERSGAVPLFYRQEPAGKRGVYGVKIEIEWSPT